MNKFASSIFRTTVFAALGLFAWAHGVYQLVEYGGRGLFTGGFALLITVWCFVIAFRRD